MLTLLTVLYYTVAETKKSFACKLSSEKEVAFLAETKQR